MSEQYLGEIRMFAGNFAPANWAFCDGRQLAISEYDALFALLGTTYGGDGETTFALPDLRGRLPVNQGTGPDGTPYALGAQGGSETVTLTSDQLPQHTHTLAADGGGANQESPAGHVPARSNLVDAYIGMRPNLSMRGDAISPVGGGQPHDNMQPYLSVSFIIALVGVWPQQQ